VPVAPFLLRLVGITDPIGYGWSYLACRRPNRTLIPIWPLLALLWLVRIMEHESLRCAQMVKCLTPFISQPVCLVRPSVRPSVSQSVCPPQNKVNDVRMNMRHSAEYFSGHLFFFMVLGFFCLSRFCLPIIFLQSALLI
jgi:hypothetical protein